MKTAILHAIKQADIISVYRHVNPDHDALGSQWGLVNWLRQRYPEKQVYACGFHRTIKGIAYPEPDMVSDDTLAASTAIVLDSANQQRIDDQRYAIAKQIIKIDHHPETDHYGDLFWVDPTKASTCEMITELLMDEKPQPFDVQVAAYLLGGIMSDTIMFSIKNVSASTLKIASFLMESGVDINELHQKLYHMSLKDFEFINYIRAKATLVEEGLLACFISHEDLVRFNMHPNLAKEYIYALANIHEIDIWALFIQVEVDGTWMYNGSLRSKHVTINHIAANYNGGGHKLAAAVKHVTYKEAMTILKACAIAIKEAHHEH